MVALISLLTAAATVFILLLIVRYRSKATSPELGRTALLKEGTKLVATVTAVTELTAPVFSSGPIYARHNGEDTVRRQVDFTYADASGSQQSGTDSITCLHYGVPRIGDQLRIRVDPSEPARAIIVQDKLTGIPIPPRAD